MLSYLYKFNLEIIVFISGAAVMIFELVGSRVLAPVLGTSLYVWAALIGVVLGMLSAGYLAGGRLADRHANYGALAGLLFGASVSVLFSAVFKDSVLELAWQIPDLRLKALCSSFALFGLPSFFFGTISPYAAKLKLSDLTRAGADIGMLYGISTLGSIAGTFAAGFFLIPYFGSTNMLYSLAVMLALTSFFAYGGAYRKVRIVILAVALTAQAGSLSFSRAAESRGFLRTDTPYANITIRDSIDGRTGRPIRLIQTDPFGIQGAVFTDKDDAPVFDYIRFFRLAGDYAAGAGKYLVIGGSAYALPKDILRRDPGARTDVVEIDPVITSLAQKYFSLPEDPRLAIYHEDGRTFLNRHPAGYDAVFMDAFNSALSIPFQLTTREAVQRVYEALDSEGVAIVNMISALEGDAGRFFRAEYRTYKEFFPRVDVYMVNRLMDPAKPGNLILVASKSEDSAARGAIVAGDLSNNLYTGKIDQDVPILTDDLAPVERYTMKIFDGT